MTKIILQINSVANTGSTGRIAEELGLIALSKGWQSYIAYGRSANKSKSELIQLGRQYDVYSHILKTRIFDSHGLGSKNATDQLINRIKEIKPDIIHFHNLHGYYLNIEKLFNYLATQNYPIIWTLHDCWAFTGHCSHFTTVNCNKWKELCKNCPQTNQYPASVVFDNSTRNFNLKKRLFNSVSNITLVPVSNWLNSFLKNSLLSKFPSKVINNGVDLNIFYPRANINAERTKYGLHNRYVILGVSGIWTSGKGLNDFIELSNSLNEDETIILVGLQKEQLRGLPKNIIAIEKTENKEELALFYSLADVFINPTYADTFPTTNLESLACGTPIITYDTDGSPESITSKTGIVVEQGNLTDLRLAIATVKLKGKNAYKEFCVKRAKQNYNKNDRFNEYFKLYKEILDTAKR